MGKRVSTKERDLDFSVEILLMAVSGAREDGPDESFSNS